jgi:hypothetical protein
MLIRKPGWLTSCHASPNIRPIGSTSCSHGTGCREPASPTRPDEQDRKAIRNKQPAVYAGWIRQQGKWALIYQHSYASTDDAQQAQWVGSWGPIIETFQGYYTGSNPMGALGVQLRSADSTGAWGAWGQLGPDQALLRQDNVGFANQALDPYYDWIVKS